MILRIYLLTLTSIASFMLSSISYSMEKYSNEELIHPVANEMANDSIVEHDVGPDLIAQPQPEKHIINSVTYISGGIGTDEIITMKRLAKEYPLEITLMQKTENGIGYFANVSVKLSNMNGTVLLDVATDGPILLINLPNGKYLITLEQDGVVKTKHIIMRNKIHQRFVFVW